MAFPLAVTTGVRRNDGVDLHGNNKTLSRS